MKNTHSRPQSSDGAYSRAWNTKSPPPGFIDPDDGKPVHFTTPADAGRHTSAYGTTAFVFTSSRTLRVLQDQEKEDDHLQCHPNASIFSVPSTPPTSSAISLPDTSVAQCTKAHRASLTHSQLDKHSEGAMNARSLLGHKMQAAGFVNLPHNRASRRDAGFPGAQSTSAHSQRTLASTVTAMPTPRNPPDFPPILFVKPAHLTTTPMWEYQQNEMDSSLATTDAGRIGLGSVTSSSVGSSESAPRPLGASSSSSMSERLPHQPFSSSPSLPGSDSSDPFPPASSSIQLSSSSYPSFQTDQANEHATRSRPSGSGSRFGIGNAGEWRADPGEYPLPTPRASPRSHRSAGTHGSRASSTMASPTIGGAIPPIAHPSSCSSSSSSSVHETPCGSSAVSSSDSSTSSSSRPPNVGSYTDPYPRRRRRSSEEKRAKAKAKDKTVVATEETSAFSTARRLGYQRPYSFTELCGPSSFVWMSKSEMFAPPAPIARSPNVSTIAPSSSRPPGTVAEAGDPPPRPTPHRRRRTKAYGGTPATEGRVHRIASAPLRLPTISSEPGSGSERDSEKVRKPKRATAAKGGDHSPTHAPIDKDPKGAFLPAVDIAGVKSCDGSTVKKRGRDTRGKTLGASESMEDRAAGGLA